MKLLTSSLVFAAIGEASADGGIIWSSTGGGWRSMAASTSYAQVFSRLGLLGGTNDGKDTNKIVSVASTSGSSWFSAQFFFSSQYYDTIVNGTPESLGEFTKQWFEAYASTQANIPMSCEDIGSPALEELCSNLSADNSLRGELLVISLAASFNYSWPNIVYEMFDAASKTYNDSEFVSVKASSDERLSELSGIDMCFHSSLLPNARAREASSITYLASDVTNASSSYTVPLPADWCVNDASSDWNSPLPGGNIYSPAPETFVGSTAYQGFPLFPPAAGSTKFTTPEGNLTSATDMSPPFGGDPTAVQISTASSSTMGYMSEEAASYFAQFMSVLQTGIKADPSFTDVQKVEIKELLEKAQDELWSTGLLADAATCSVWTEPNPVDMPAARDSSYWFTDGGYTDGPAAGIVLGRYQQTYGTDGEIKLILSNNNYYTNNMNNILAYFSNDWNKDVEPGAFLWPPGVGESPQYNPQQSNQVFSESMDGTMLDAMLEPINGTNITAATISATTVDNDVYSVVAGQKVSILLLNLNADIPTFLLGPQINAYTPAMVEMVKTNAGSQNLADTITAFVGGSDSISDGSSEDSSEVTSPPPAASPESESSSGVNTAAVAASHSFVLFVLFCSSVLLE